MDAVLHKSSFLLLLLALTLVRGLLFGMLIPPWQAPDEPQHYQMVRLIMELKRFPSTDDARLAVDLRNSVLQSLRDNQFWELRHRRSAPDIRKTTANELLSEEKLDAAVGHPPLYYALASLVLSPLRSSSILTHLYILRTLSVLMSLVTVWAVYTVAIWLSPQDRTRAWAAGFFVAFLPMHSFMAGALNNDALAQMLSTVVVVLLAWTCFRGLSPARLGGLIFVLSLSLLTKRTTLFLIPLVLVVLSAAGTRLVAPLHNGFKRPVGPKMKSGLILPATVLVIVLVLVLLYDGSARHWWDIPAQLSYIFDSEHYTGGALARYPGFALLGFASFWANFGWLTVPLDVGWYVVLAVLSLVAFLGGLRGAWRVWHDRPGGASRRCVWRILGLAILLVFAQSLVSMLSRQIPPQGRYLFPALVPIALCFTWGVFEWVPQGYRRIVLGLWMAWWIAFDLIGAVGYVLPYFYG
jgi:hypothetical protein